MRNGGVLNTRVFGINMTSCVFGTDVSGDDNTDINGMRAFRARKYIYDTTSHHFLEMNVQQIAGRGPQVVIARSDLEGSSAATISINDDCTNKKKKKKTAIALSTSSSCSSASSVTSSSTSCNSENKAYSYGDSTLATLWESSILVDTTNSRSRKQIKVVLSTDDKSKRKRVMHYRANVKAVAAKSAAVTKAATQNTIRAKLKHKFYACSKPNCTRIYLSQRKLVNHEQRGKCYNGKATQCVTTRCKKRDKAKNVTGVWESKPSLIPKLDFCIQLAQNDQLSTALLDNRDFASSATLLSTAPTSIQDSSLLKPERRSKGQSCSTDTLTKKTQTAHNLTSAEADSYFVPPPHHLGALKAKSTKTPRLSSQLLCVVQAFQKGVDDKKEKLTSTQFANQMAIMGTFIGEEKFPNNAWMKCNPHGFPTFAKIELLNRHQVKSYFGTGMKKLESTHQNLLDKELSTCELDFIASMRNEISLAKVEKSPPLIIKDIIVGRFASHLSDKKHAQYELTAGKVKCLISGINSTIKAGPNQFWLPGTPQYTQIKYKELKRDTIIEHVRLQDHNFIRR